MISSRPLQSLHVKNDMLDALLQCLLVIQVFAKCTYVTHACICGCRIIFFRWSGTECFPSPFSKSMHINVAIFRWRGFGSVRLPQFDPARIQPICALLLNPLLLHPHPTIALHVLPSPLLQIITTHRGSQEDSPLLCSCPQRFHQARLPRHPSPYRPGWYRSYRVRVGQRSSG